MKTKYCSDVLAYVQFAECKTLVSSLIPDEIYHKLDEKQKIAWADLFARAGFAEYDERLKERLFGVRGAGVSVGTFVRVGERLWFEAVDNDGYWCSDLTALQLWHWRSLYVNFCSTCGGVADFGNDFVVRKADELAAKVILEATENSVFRCLLSLGKLYVP